MFSKKIYKAKIMLT